MKGYLGEFDTEINREFTAHDWALWYIGRYGGFDGDHHKTWVLDQVARILHGTPVIRKEARWDNGHAEFRAWTGDPSAGYQEWVREMKDGEDGPDTYGYDEGIAP